ncbi:MAG: hypothetical protein J0I06_04250 [Planctomycetes bacterium]|nr:hypothetical protein [Planctomycetota bacterium]
MITQRKVSIAIEEAGRAFQTCWESLRIIRAANKESLSADHILEFQPRLAKAIHGLGEMHRAVKSEARETVNRKSFLRPNRFKTRMRILRKYEDALNEAIRVGKAIGDGFAWLFYQGESALLAKHLQHSEITHPPGGIGGRGECRFITDLRVVNGHLVLYHGITSILRLGDVSLVDLKAFKVTGIGELKSDEPGDGT